MTTQAFDLTSAEFKRNPAPTLAEMRKQGTLIRVKLPLVGQAWITTTYEATTTVLRDKELFVTEPRNSGRAGMPGLAAWLPRSIKALTNSMIGKDEPDHRRLRKLVESAFVKQSIDQMRPQLEKLANRQLDLLEIEARRSGSGIDLMEHFARPFPLAVICEMLGLPEEDRPKFARWASGMTSSTGFFGILKAMPGIGKMNRYLTQQFEECRKNPRPGMISALVNAEEDGDRLTQEELLAMSFMLLIAGHETTVHLLTWGVLTLLRHPEQKRELMSDWEKMPGAVEEILRYCSTIEMTKPRYVSRDIELYGRYLRKKELVMPLLVAANHDPEHFPNPEQFDIHRQPNSHMGFGSGIHNCLGMKLARAEAQIAFKNIFSRYPNLKLSIPDEKLEYQERLAHRSLKRLPIDLQKDASLKEEEQSHAA